MVDPLDLFLRLYFGLVGPIFLSDWLNFWSNYTNFLGIFASKPLGDFNFTLELERSIQILMANDKVNLLLSNGHLIIVVRAISRKYPYNTKMLQDDTNYRPRDPECW